MKNGVMATINQTIDFDTAAIVASDLGFEPAETEAAPAPVVAPTVKPRSVLPLPRLMALALLPVILTMVASGAGCIAGIGSVPLGCVNPVIVMRLAVASWPMNFWLVRSVTGPV